MSRLLLFVFLISFLVSPSLSLGQLHTYPCEDCANTFSGTNTFNGVTTFPGGISGAFTPAVAGGSSLGTSLLPYSSVFVGNAATNNIQITGTATGARVFTLPDANSNPVQPSTAPANQFATGISSSGVISYSQPSFGNLSGLISLAQTPLTTRGDLLVVGVGPALTRLPIGGANLYPKSNGTDIVFSSLAAGGVGTCTNQVVTALNADAAPTCSAITSAFMSPGTTGSGNFVLASAPTITNAVANQNANAATALTSTRATDTSPTGNFLSFKTAGGTPIFGVDVLGNLTAVSENNRCLAAGQSGADAGAKIAACVMALNVLGGGVIDASGIVGAQTSSSNPFSASTVPILLLGWNGTITTSACWNLPSNTAIVGQGPGVTKLKLAAEVNTCYAIQNADFVNGNSFLTVQNMSIDGNALNQSPNIGLGQRTGTILFKKVTHFWIQQNDIRNAYNYHVEILDGARDGHVERNHIDGSVLGSGILFGNTPVGAGGSTGSEVYDMWAVGNHIFNVGGGDCLFSTGSDTAGSYGTTNIHFNNNTLFNCADISIEVGDGTTDAEATHNIIAVAPSVTVTSIQRASNVVTASVSCSWNTLTDMGCLTAFSVGAPFCVAGVTDSTFNISVATCASTPFTVSSVNYAGNSLTYAQTGANSTSSGGTLTRQGNDGLMARSSQNVAFTANVIHGNPLAANQDAEFAWHQAGDSVAQAQNITFEDIAFNNGRTGLTISADVDGAVTQVDIKSKYLGSGTNDFTISSHAQGVRLDSGGYISSGTALSGMSFNQTNDIQLRPGTGSAVKAIVSSTSTGLGISNADFTPATLLHTRSASGGTDVTFEQTVDGNMNVQWKNSHPQSYVMGIRSAASNCAAESFLLRDTQGNNDLWCWNSATGNFAATGTMIRYGNVPTADYGVPSIQGTPVHLIGQTAALGSTNLFSAAPTAGKYSVCFDAITTVTGTGTTGTVSIGWTDEGGAKTFTSPTWALNSTTVTGQANSCLVVSTTGTANITVSTAGTFGTSVYLIDAYAERTK